jgi:adsorption protein B
MDELFFFIWLGMRVAAIALVILFSLSLLDDFLRDVLCLIAHRLSRPPPIDPAALEAAAPKPVAILVPAWRSGRVLGRMLEHTINTLDYPAYTIFVGCYSVDADSQAAVEDVRRRSNRVELLTLLHSRNAGRADCLNEMYKSILQHEREQQIRFELFLVLDPGDVVHPQTLKYANVLAPPARMLQFPLLALEPAGLGEVAHAQVDEWAERALLEWPARARLCGYFPSMGSGTVFSSEAVNFLAGQGDYRLFDERQAAELFQAGLALRDLPGPRRYLAEWVERKAPRDAKTRNPLAVQTVRELVAILFSPPISWRSALARQTRWYLGAGLQAGPAGPDTAAGRYFRWHDRKAPWIHLAAGPALLVLAYAAGGWAAAAAGFESAPPPLFECGEIYTTLLVLAAGLLAWRGLVRAACTGVCHGSRQALLSIPRQAPALALRLAAAARATWYFLRRSAFEPRALWEQETVNWPAVETGGTIAPRIGDLLIQQQHITPPQLAEALQQQKATQQPLGEILVQSGALNEEDLVSTLADQHNAKSIEIDPYAVPLEVLGLVPRSLAERYQVFPLATDGATVVLATNLTNRDAYEDELSLLLGRPVEFRWTSSADIRFAIERGYARTDQQSINLTERLGPRLLRDGLITEPDLKLALRKQKRTRKRLGEVLIEMQFLTEDQLRPYLK